MTHSHYTKAHLEAASAVACPYCKAMVSDPCATTGRSAHPSRYAAFDAFRRAAFTRSVEEQQRALQQKYPDGDPLYWQPMQWYRVVSNEATTWTFSGREGGCGERLCYVHVEDTGSRFRWRVELIDGQVWDAGYASSLSKAHAKALAAHDECVRACTQDEP